MSKGLEALHRIANAKNHFKYDTLELVDKDFQIVQQELQRLEAIENANPSEALDCLEYLGDFKLDVDILLANTKAFPKIKQALLKAQEQEKVLKIIFEKNVNVFQLRLCKTLDEYNARPKEERLTEEEFDLLKRYFK